MQLLATLLALLVLAGLVGLIPVWRSASWPVPRRIRHSLVVLVGLIAVGVLNDWNIIGFRYH